MLYSEDVNKKVRIQNAVQSKKDINETNKIEKLDYNLINKYNPDVSVNINKYLDDDLLAIKKKAIFKTFKNYLFTFEEIKEKNKKKKIYRIRKRKPTYAQMDNQTISREEVFSSNLEKNNYNFNDIEELSKEAYKKSLLIRLYGFYLGNLIYEKVFLKYKF